MISIVVCDDQEIIRNQLKNHISTYIDERKIEVKIDEFSSGIQLLKKIKCGEKYDCIFLDIDLKENINGIDIAKLIRNEYKKKIIIIFVTSYTQYQNRVLSLHTFDYINKPFKSAQIYKVLDDFFYWVYEEKKQEKLKIQFKTINGIVSLDIEEILYFEYSHRRINIVTESTVYYMYESMKRLSIKLEQYLFIMPHTSFLINPKYIKLYSRSNNVIVMMNGASIPISQLKIKDFRMKYNKFLKTKGMLVNGY